MVKKSKIHRYWASIPPWIFIGAAVVLIPIIAFMTVQNINRQKDASFRLLLEKGAALIRSFEAGTRTGMMGMMRSGFKLQRLLTETSQQPDIAYLLVTDNTGRVMAHSDLSRIDDFYGTDLNLANVSLLETLRWRIVSRSNGRNVFEVYRKFSPTAGRLGNHHGYMMRPQQFMRRGEAPQTSSQVIFVGLDMGSIEAARMADTRHSIIMGLILLFIGFAGVILLSLAQSYRATKASLSRIKAFSDNLVENMPIGLIAINDQRKIASFNHVAEFTLGLSAEKLIGQDAVKVLPVELLQQIDTLDAGSSLIEKEIECSTQKGKRIPLEVGAQSLRDADGNLFGYVLLFKDLSEIRALRREIARNQRLASVGRLAAGVAHEIRNPLSSIKGLATYFKERYQDKLDDQQIANIMIQEVDRLNRVVGQLLDFARPIKISKKPISMQALIEDSLKLVERQASEKNIKIETRFPAQMDPVSVDPDRLNQVLLNLYLNAIDSMDAGGRLAIIIPNSQPTHNTEIKIMDDGTGISREDLAHIFDPYFTTKATGTGLGLAIVHNIVDAHGGKVTVESHPGRGTTFTISLPLTAKDESDD
jgi:two-component system sensor histidine kinase HydH